KRNNLIIIIYKIAGEKSKNETRKENKITNDATNYPVTPRYVQSILRPIQKHNRPNYFVIVTTLPRNTAFT
ncbi:hypothetical protein, partial [Hallella colorans]|uniref:hypothetical protein n=1 Tax=Hallella colorans TaxID=1703337 RepID=UPI0023F309C1